jgi:RimJ/RimL family protein N-acetyltransferase
MRRLMLAHAAGNDASGAVARRCGFVEWGREPAAELLGDGTHADLVWLARPVVARPAA